MTKRRRGRPTVGERVPLGLRVTPEMKRRLDEAALASGRSQSQEAELRLEHSFEHGDLLAEVLTLAYGKEIAGFVIMLGPVMKSVADYCNIIRLMEHNAPSGHWTTDPHIFDQVAQQVTTLLEAIRPSGPTISQPPVTAAAEQMIREVRGDAGHSGFGETAKTVQRLLGPLAERLKDNKQYWDEPPQQSLAGLSSTAIDAIRLENLARQVVEVGKTLALALTARSHEARPKNRPQIEPRRKRSTKREKRRGAD